MSNPCQNARIFVLAIAAAIQYVGASAKRQFLYLVKLLIITLPGMKNVIDKGLALPTVRLETIIDSMKDITLKLLNPYRDKTLDLDVISDFAVDILFWILTALVSVLSLIGVLIESMTGFVANLLRLICSKNGNNTPPSLKNELKSFFKNIRKTADVLSKLTDANKRWRVDKSVVNTNYGCVTSEYDNKASAFSFAAQKSDYTDSGVRYDFQLKNGKIEYGKRSSGIEGLKAVNNIPYPFRMTSFGWSFHEFRKGVQYKNLTFDMLAASNDRVFVKVKDKADFYFAVMDEMFWSDNIPIPSIYFKLDPQFGETNNGDPIDPSSLVRQISDNNNNLLNFQNHPQAERLPMFHATIGMGILDAMIVSVKPRTWYRLDTRPPHYGVSISPELNDEYATREASRYRGTSLSGPGPEEKISKHEFEFSKVLSLGVGNFHYYESWNDDYGGEIQPLHQSGPFNLPINMSLYGLFNGPLWDADGAIDGTCNFYILVKLKKSEKIPITSPCYNQENCYGILWCDEQTYFTKRWRLLDPRDNEPWKIDIPHDINLSLTAALRRDKESGLLNQQYNFDYDKYFDSDPFQQGWINENSRMAVARQIILITGNKGNENKLFSINFSYGSIDRQWRSRAYPKNVSVRSGIHPQHEQINIYPETLYIREDMTISIRGYNKSTLGRWFQRYLPCTRKHPENEYKHPWRFLPERAFQRADAFSHFGVYDQVNSRNQYYVVEIIQAPSSFKCPVILQDKFKQLFIKGIKFNWGLFKDVNSLENFLEDGEGDSHLPERIRKGTELEALSEKLLFRWDQMGNSDDQYRKSQTSAHNKHATFRMLNRGPLGYILVWEDKRDDDLISLSELPKEVLMKGHGVYKLRIIRNVRVTSLPNVFNVSLSLLQNNKKLKVLIETEQNEIDAISNLWALRIAALPEGGSPDRVMIYETENLFKHANFKINYNANSNWLTLEGEVEINESYSQYLSDGGALKHATSVWFEDIVGHVSTPDLIKFS